MIRLVALCLLVASFCRAGEAGREGHLFMRLAGDARSGALGTGAAALTEGDAALFGNPAGAVLRRQLIVSDTVLFWPAGFFGETLAGQWPLGQGGGMGASMFLLHHDALPVTTEAEPDGTGSLARMMNVELALMASQWLSETAAVGANIRLLHEELGDLATKGAAVDIGGVMVLTPEITVGAALRGLGRIVRAQDVQDAFPFSIDASVRVAPPDLPARGYAGGQFRPQGPSSGGLGVELGELYGAILRGGIHYTEDGRAVLTGGAGAYFDVWHFDYCLGPVGELGYMNRLTLAVRFGSRRR